jgi:hypothetical protein
MMPEVNSAALSDQVVTFKKMCHFRSSNWFTEKWHWPVEVA